MLNSKNFAIFHSVEEDLSRYDVEVCQPLVLEEESKDTGIKFYEETNYIYTIHIGIYDNFSYANSAL